jgi:peptidoglycan pentaglycine glycine transferase (the first glycine)
MFLTYFEQSKAELWNQFVRAEAADGGFLQSAVWAKFQKELGNQAWCLAVTSNEKDKNSDILAIALVLKLSLPLGQYILYIPRGPIVAQKVKEDQKQFEKVMTILLAEIKKLAQEEKVLLLRLDPAWLAEEKLDKSLAEIGFKHVEKEVQPQSTLLVPITKSREELLKAMKAKTRYNIKLAEKKGVKVIQSNEPKAIKQFWQLMKVTAQREKFRSYSQKYYQQMIDSMGKEHGQIFLAQYENRILATAMVIFFPPVAIYLHGASSNEQRNFMAPYILHWQIIQEAQRRGCQFYDWWGIADDSVKRKGKDWGGFSRFKRGFDPVTPITNYIGTWHYIFQPLKYKTYQLARWAKKIKSW